jgi:hypothetical protein
MELLTSLGGVSKLTITPLQKNVNDQSAGPILDYSKELVCQFNPETMELKKSNLLNYRTDVGDDVPEVIYSGGLSGTLRVDLLFDSTDSGDDVRDMYQLLVKYALVDKGRLKSQPPQVVVQWGDFIGFICIISDIRQEFTFFAPDGTPLRANVHVCFREAFSNNKYGGQNPTSRSEARRTWIVEQGQRLDWIAYQEYGDTSAWRHIAEANGILDPLSIRPGQILKLTARS